MFGNGILIKIAIKIEQCPIACSPEFFCSHLLSKYVKIKIQRATFFRVDLYGYET